MTNPIPTSNMWVTCPTMGELMERLAGSTSNPKELALIMHGAMLALNTAHYLVEAELKETV